MASKAISSPISMPSSKNRYFIRRKRSYYSNTHTIVASLLHLALFQLMFLFILTMPSPTEPFSVLKRVVITNNYTKLLSVRCFNFHDGESSKTRRLHLKPGETYSFIVVPRRFYPSATMYNCSTNMGVFVAYRYGYNCTTDPDPNRDCEWMFDQSQSYMKTDSGTWQAVDYHPNYESLGRGGVVKGYFTN